eukprot:scaffold630_cov399-Prasinococcus_capsulatus_cf.AAC.3
MWILGEPLSSPDRKSLYPQIQASDKLTLQNLLAIPAPVSRVRVQQLQWEEHRNGGLELCLPPTIKWISGFRLDEVLYRQSTGCQVAASAGFGTATSSSFHPASIHKRPLSERVLDDTPDHVKIRVTAFQEATEGQGRTAKHVGVFHLPCVREGMHLHYDFSGPLMARTILFELLADMRGAVTDGNGTTMDPSGDWNFKSLAGKIKLYQYVPTKSLA